MTQNYSSDFVISSWICSCYSMFWSQILSKFVWVFPDAELINQERWSMC